LALIIVLAVGIANIDKIFPTPAAAERMKNIVKMADSDIISTSYGTNPDAKVSIIDFSDFQCPACKMFSGQLRAIMEYYGDQINVDYKHFPINPNSYTLAEASECARDYGKFWEYHDILFESTEKHNTISLTAIATSLGIDASEFSTCLQTGEKKEKVNTDQKVGGQIGVKGTPTIIINGLIIEGARSFEELKEIIDKELANE